MRKFFEAWRPIVVSVILALLLSSNLFFQPIEAKAQWTLAVGLFLTYLSIGILVALLPLWGPRWLFGLLVGLGYSLPGAVFTTAPYPLKEDAARIWFEFAGGGTFTLVTTLLVGAVVGVLCAFAKPLPEGVRDPQTAKLKQALTPHFSKSKRPGDDASTIAEPRQE